MHDAEDQEGRRRPNAKRLKKASSAWHLGHRGTEAPPHASLQREGTMSFALACGQATFGLLRPLRAGVCAVCAGALGWLGSPRRRRKSPGAMYCTAHHQEHSSSQFRPEAKAGRTHGSGGKGNSQTRWAGRTCAPGKDSVPDSADLHVNSNQRLCRSARATTIASSGPTARRTII
eukprot:COSAG04_NODE_3964_length_2392_cov_3.443088_2_plen_175_part_00